MSRRTTKTKRQAVRPSFPAHYRPARVNTRVLGCPAQPAFLRPLLTQKTRPRKGSRASAHQHQIVLRELERVAGGQDAADGKYLRTSAEVQTSDERIYLCA